VRTPTNPFKSAGTSEVFVRKEIIDQDIFAGPNTDLKGRKADHYLVVWEDYPLQKDYTWEPIENLYGQEELVETYEKWLKADNERLDIEEMLSVVGSSFSAVLTVGRYPRTDGPLQRLEPASLGLSSDGVPAPLGLKTDRCNALLEEHIAKGQEEKGR
jgi:hypothetical protein